jgi:NAD-dependent dihydropyrimidine dehydrogenase PreA subunit
MTNKIPVILAKHRPAGTQQEQLEKDLVRGLAGIPGAVVTVIPHLYDLAPDGPALQRLRSIPGDLVVLSWLYPRAAYWVLDANQVQGRLGPTFSLQEGDLDEPARQLGSDASDRTIWCFDLRTHDRPEPYLGQIERIAAMTLEAVSQAAEPAPHAALSAADEVLEAVQARWYPVVDFSRCTNCLECLNFCLFGVYSLDPRQAILVEQPDACRPGCPACARVCPQGAIMFPQHKDPAIAGDPKASSQAAKLDLSQLLSGVDPADLAAAERLHALREQQAPKSVGPRPDRDKTAGESDLDRLVDEVDDLKL